MLLHARVTLQDVRLMLMCASLAAGVSCARTGKDSADDSAPDAMLISASQPGNQTTTAGDGQAGISPANANTPSGLSVGVAPIETTAVVWPNLGFVNNPGGKDAKAVALTFDDGPDGKAPIQWGKASPSNTTAMLDALDKLNLKATFFVCGNLWTDVTTDTQAQTDVQRMVKSGHHVGSHTFTHAYLTANTPRNVAAGKTTMSPAQVKGQFDKNVAAFAPASLLGPEASQFTLYRAPYGNPFQDGIVYPPDANSIVDDVTAIAPYTPPNAVHIGWGIDTNDWQCAQNRADVACILKNLNAFLDAGASGPILMHSVYALSAEALPLVVQSIYEHGYHIVMVEDLIKDKYGAHSADIARANAKKTFTAEQINEAAVAAAKESKWYKRTNEG